MAKRSHDPERLFDLDLVRCTENGALAAWKWIGKGNKNAADSAASSTTRRNSRDSCWTAGRLSTAMVSQQMERMRGYLQELCTGWPVEMPPNMPPA